MRTLTLVLALVTLVGCYYRARRYPPREPTPAPPRQPPESKPHPQSKQRQDVPPEYRLCVRRLYSLREHLQELVSQDRLFEVHDTAEYAQAVAEAMPKLVKFDITNRILDEVDDIGRKIVEAAQQIDRAADAERKDDVASWNARIPDLISALRRYENLSDEYEVKDIPHNCPATYKRALTRLNGIHNSIKERVEKDRLFEIHSVAEHLRVVGENIGKLASQDVTYPMKDTVEKQVEALKAAIHKLHTAADREDRTSAERVIEELKNPIDRLDGVYRQYSGRSALD